MEKMLLVNYFDVWGNEEDGYEINNLCNEGEIEVPDNPTSKDLIQALIEFEFFRDHVTEDHLEIYDHGGSMVEFYEKETLKPICRLEFIEN